MAFETGWLQGPIKMLTRPMLHHLWDLHVEGLDNIPKRGGALITPNHLAFFDSVVVSTLMPRRTMAVGKADYMDSWKTKFIFPATGMIPIDRSGGAASEAALSKAADSLLGGDLFMIYPEGTRSRSGYLHKGRTGAARLALRTSSPIIPIGLRGTPEVQPVNAPRPKTGLPIEVRIGKPIDVSRYQDKKDDRLILRQITDEVMFEIAELSGQRYVNVYAGDPLPAHLSPTAEPVPAGKAEARQPAMAG